MPEPVIVPRAEHSISRRDIDPDALKVLYRLNQFNHIAYLVGGGVRDMLLQRRPKDFDIGTDAHPHQIKKLFRNCWIIGRRFRLAHVRFGNKAIEVATFRRQMAAGADLEPAGEAIADGQGNGAEPPDAHPHENSYGTPEQDAFRRDFTINALFYDIANFSVIDYVGGLQDLDNGLIRSIGDPGVRFQEDPVRMLRALALAARLDFTIDPAIEQAIGTHHALIATASPARLMEEYYKVLRSGAAEPTFRLLAAHGLLENITPELHGHQKDAFWQSLTDLDAYRQRFDAIPESLTNAILLGTLLVPLDLVPKRTLPAPESVVERPEKGRFRRFPKEPPLKMGMLQVARRDTERLRQILGLQRRLADTAMSPRARQALVERSPFAEALTWFDIHTPDAPTVANWRELAESARPTVVDGAAEGEYRPRRRRRRGRRGPRPSL